jgi:hypothetical protein
MTRFISMTDIRQNIHYNTTVKTYEFVTTRVTGLAHLRTGLVITDTSDDSACLASFPHYIVENQPVTNTILFEGESNLMSGLIEQTQSSRPIVIGCSDPQWSYVLYMLVVLTIGNPPSFEHAAFGLRSIIDQDSRLPKPSTDTLNRLARILTNYAVFEKFDESITDRNSTSEDVHRLISEEYDRQILMLSLVFERTNIETDFRDSPNVLNPDPTDLDVRPPDPPRIERLVDPVDYLYNHDLNPIDPEFEMAYTSGEKPGPLPSMADCLGITSYSGYEPTPDEEEFRDEVITLRELEKKVGELKSLMCGRRYNEAYAQNLLQSGMTPEEVFCLLTLEV